MCNNARRSRARAHTHTQAKHELADNFQIQVYLSTVSALGDVTAGICSNACMHACIHHLTTLLHSECTCHSTHSCRFMLTFALTRARTITNPHPNTLWSGLTHVAMHAYYNKEGRDAITNLGVYTCVCMGIKASPKPTIQYVNMRMHMNIHVCICICILDRYTHQLRPPSVEKRVLSTGGGSRRGEGT